MHLLETDLAACSWIAAWRFDWSGDMAREQPVATVEKEEKQKSICRVRSCV